MRVTVAILIKNQFANLKIDPQSLWAKITRDSVRRSFPNYGHIIKHEIS